MMTTLKRLALPGVLLVAGVVGAWTVGAFWTAIGGVAVYIAGVVFTLWIHGRFLQMVEPPLVWVRAVVWPVWWTTGWPSGEPRRMD